jgi:hypothetical protein
VVGAETGKILFMSTRSKYCPICQAIQRKSENADDDNGTDTEKSGETPKSHKCCKNWGENQSSGGMESDIIKEGFSTSVTMHGLVYKKMVGDGDSNTMKALTDAQPYKGITIEKIECKNHLWRVFLGHMRILSNTPNKSYSIQLRKTVTARIFRIRRKINQYISLRNGMNTDFANKIVLLRNDIMRSLNCIFCEHSDCIKTADAICTDKDRECKTNFASRMKTTALWEKIKKPIFRLINNSKSLLANMDSNRVECANAVIAKHSANKSKLFSRSYKTRVSLAVTSFNNEGSIYRKLYKKAVKHSPGSQIKRMESRRQCRNRPKDRVRQKMRKKLFVQSVNPNSKNAPSCKYYGESAETPPMEGSILEKF